MRLTIETFNLTVVERTLCVEALNLAGTIVEASALLGITRHALKRRIIKHDIEWPPRRVAGAPGLGAPVATPSAGLPSASPIASSAVGAGAAAPLSAPSAGALRD